MKQRLLCGIFRVAHLQGLSTLCHLQAVRSVSDIPVSVSSPLKQWTVAVSPFTRINCHLHCNISVKPLDPHVYPGADQAFITLHSLHDGLNENRDIQSFKLNTFHVHYDEQSQELRIYSDTSNSNRTVELTTPVKSDLQIVTQGTGDVTIQKMECDLCHVQTERGHCALHSVKSHKVKVQSSEGNITGTGTIHGDVDISTAGDGSVDIKKIQGTSMNLSTEHGPLKVKAIYAQSSSVASSTGKIHIGHLHGEADVKSDTGDIIIDSSSGALAALTNAGNIDVYVSQAGTAELNTQQGSVSVRVPASLKAGVQLCGTMVDISSEISQETEHRSAEGKTVLMAQLNSGTQKDCWIKATANRGTVSLKTQSWFETLRLGS